MVGHSTGGGEVARYIGRHGTKRVAKAVLLGAVPPLMLKTAANPGGLPIEVFDGIRAGVTADRSQFFKDLTRALLRLQPAGREGLAGRARLVLAAGHAWAGIKGPLDCIKQFSETDFTEDLKKIDVPTLIVARRRRPDRADRRRGHAVVQARQGRDAEGLSGRAARPGEHARRTSSTPTCWPSSRAERPAQTAATAGAPGCSRRAGGAPAGRRRSGTGRR